MDWNVTELGSVPCSPLTSPGTAGKWLLAGDTTVFTTAPTSEVPAALVGSKTSSWVPAEDTAAGGHLVTENTCVHSKELPGSSSERCRSLCPCTYTPTCSCETRALFHWDPQAGVVCRHPFLSRTDWDSFLEPPKDIFRPTATFCKIDYV